MPVMNWNVMAKRKAKRRWWNYEQVQLFDIAAWSKEKYVFFWPLWPLTYSNISNFLWFHRKEIIIILTDCNTFMRKSNVYIYAIWWMYLIHIWIIRATLFMIFSKAAPPYEYKIGQYVERTGEIAQSEMFNRM